MDAGSSDGHDLSEGSTFDVESFLSKHDIFGTSDGKCHNIEFKVAVKTLKGKVVMICCFSLPLRDGGSAVAQAVLLASSELRALSSAFQLVLVVDVSSYRDSDQQLHAFRDFVSKFPSLCLALPFPDRCTIIPGSIPTGFLVNRSLIILWHKPLDFFLEFGAEAFPFTPERLHAVTKCDRFYRFENAWNPLHSYLCFKPLPFPRFNTSLSKNPGAGQVYKTINGLVDESKLIGLYLCQTGSLIPRLDKTHKKCLAQGLELEIILVYLPFKDFENPQLFQNRITSTLTDYNISWFVLPFVNWVSRRLWRFCHKDADDRLIIIDPKSKFVEYHGETVIRHFGTSGFPFSMKRLLSRESDRLRTVTLELLLAHSSLDTLPRKDPGRSCQLPLSALKCKNVLLYLHYAWDHCDKFFESFISYCQNKANDPDFKVVFVELGKPSSPHFGSPRAMPWLVCHLDPRDLDYVTRTVFREGSKCSTLVGFGKDGRICALRPQELVCSSCPDFPFNDNLHNESSADLCGREVPSFGSRGRFNLFSESKNTFKALHSLLGKEYFFPVPFGGSYDEEERDQYPVSKIDFYFSSCEVAQYPNEIEGKIPEIDTINFDVVSFLSTNNRRYLYRNDMDNSVILVESLGVKKWVMICCFICPVYSKSSVSYECRAVSNLCSELYDKFGDSFEMVLVFKMGRDFQVDESAFRHMLSGFPSLCLVVPFWDSCSRDYICRSLGFSKFSTGILLHVNERKVIWHDNLACFDQYGVDTFPFTKESFDKIDMEEDGESWNRQSLKKLFRCSSSTVLSRKIPGVAGLFKTTTIGKLDGKLVGVYLCFNGDSIPMLHELYVRCTAFNMALEVVVVHFPLYPTNSDPKLFEEKINRALEKRNLSWWVFPFKNWVSLRLNRLCKSYSEDQLIIVGKGGVDPDGTYFMRELRELKGSCLSDDANGQKQKLIDKFKSRYHKSLNVASCTKRETWTTRQRKRKRQH